MCGQTSSKQALSHLHGSLDENKTILKLGVMRSRLTTITDRSPEDGQAPERCSSEFSSQNFKSYGKRKGLCMSTKCIRCHPTHSWQLHFPPALFPADCSCRSQPPMNNNTDSDPPVSELFQLVTSNPHHSQLFRTSSSQVLQSNSKQQGH